MTANMELHWSSITSVLTLPFIIFICFAQETHGGKFEIDYAHDTFLKDGQPFRYVSGSFHYARTRPEQWEDRLVKMRAAGVNALQTYVPWNVHELVQGTFTWDGAADLVNFLDLAKKHDIMVMLRLGPYMCGEWEFGGFPAWLLTVNSTMVLRSSDPGYMKFVKLWFDKLLVKVKPALYNNGGSVAMVQIENEYGSFFTCDKNYTGQLRDQVKSVLGDDVVIYTTDGAGDNYLKCGKVEGTYATVDFGGGSTSHFKSQRDFEPHGPLVNSESYTGWLDHWGSRHSQGSAEGYAKNLDTMLAYNASVNMYMYIGGTNFGYYNGANSPYQPVPTSYDYDSPISEAGDLTPKFFAVQNVIKKYLPLPSTPLPKNSTKAAYGAVPMKFVSTVQDALKVLSPQGPHKSVYPVNMEAINHYYGFILYRWVLDKDYKSATELSTAGVRDRAVVMVNKIPLGKLNRKDTKVQITGVKGQVLDILVENQGRINFGKDMLYNTKGIIQNVTLGGSVMQNWETYPINLDLINKTSIMMGSTGLSSPPRSPSGTMTTPSIYLGELDVPGTPADTFLDPRPFGKGQAIINNFNIGRYWPNRGPQVTLYVPYPILSSKNSVYLFEVESAPVVSTLNVTFTHTPYINAPNHPDAPYPMSEPLRFH